MNDEIITNKDPRTAEEKLRAYKIWYDVLKKDNIDKELYIDSIEQSINNAIDHIKVGNYAQAISELTEREIIRRPVKEMIMKFKCIGRSTWLAAYEDPATKNLYLVPYLEGIRQIQDWQFEDKISTTEMLNLLVSDDGTSALTGNGWDIVDSGYDYVFTLGHDKDYSLCSEGNDDNVRYGRLWAFEEAYIWDPIKKMLENGYLMLHYYFDENMSIPEEEDAHE